MRAPSHQRTTNILSVDSKFSGSPIESAHDIPNLQITTAQDFTQLHLSQDEYLYLYQYQDSSQDDDSSEENDITINCR